MASTVAPENRTELRLALVCYGGVSLAVYMHGVTKELCTSSSVPHAEFDKGRVPGAGQSLPRRPDGVRLLPGALRTGTKKGHPLTVSIDVIAGTSAGGINGVVLAKVLAVDGDQEGLKKLWLEEADLRTLLRGWPVGPLPGARPRRPPGRDPEAAGPVAAVVPAQRGGDVEAAAHGSRGHGRTARFHPAPAGRILDLYVTVTDLHGFEVLVPTGAGGASQRDRQNAQVLRFSVTTDDTAELGPDAAANLAFAARASSSFPGAFAPVNVSTFATEIGVADDDLTLAEHFVSPYDESGSTPSQAWFVDGGVLDNAPFDLVIGAIAGKRAQRQVLRRMVYVQPNTEQGFTPANGSGATALETPGYAQALWKVIGDVKASHSVLRDLLDLRELNTRITQVGAIADAQNAVVLDMVAGAMAAAGAGESWAVTTKDDVQKVSDELHKRAEGRAGRRLLDVRPPEDGGGCPPARRRGLHHARVSAGLQSDELRPSGDRRVGADHRCMAEVGHRRGGPCPMARADRPALPRATAALPAGRGRRPLLNTGSAQGIDRPARR